MAKAMEIGESEPVTGGRGVAPTIQALGGCFFDARWRVVVGLVGVGRFMIDGPRRSHAYRMSFGEAYSIVKGRRHGAVDPGQERLGFTADPRARLARAGSGA